MGSPSPARERACGDIDPLAITGGRVWVPFGAQAGDCSNYKGRVVGVRLDGTGSPVGYDPSTRRQGGIWNPAGPAVDPAGHLYVVSANGSSFPGDADDHPNSVLELSPSGELLDSFAPADWAQNNQGDVGLGSQGVALVGTRWAVLGGKSGPVYVLRRGHLGGIGGQVSVTSVCLSFGGAPSTAASSTCPARTASGRCASIRREAARPWHAPARWPARRSRRRPRMGARLHRRGPARPRPRHRPDP